MLSIDWIRRSMHGQVYEASQKLAPVYIKMQHTWDRCGIPNRAQIEETLHEMIDHLQDTNNSTHIQTGGLWVGFERTKGEVKFRIYYKTAVTAKLIDNNGLVNNQVNI